MPYFQRRPGPPIIANQYLLDSIIPNGIKFNEKNEAYVTTKQGQDVIVNYGEWIVKEHSGPGYYPIDNEEFQRLYKYTNNI